MHFSVAAIVALVAAVSAQKNMTMVTVTSSEFVTVCPASASVVYSGSTYINTHTVATTITIPCPTGCAHVVPISTTSSVICNSCPAGATVTPLYPSKNATIPAASKTADQVGTTSKVVAAQTSVLQAGAGKAVAYSGASLAGLLGLAAYIL